MPNHTTRRMYYDIKMVLEINAGGFPGDYKKYDQLVDYFNHLTSAEDIAMEKVKMEKINVILQLTTYREKWDYAELELEGNILDTQFKNFCWMDLKQYPPRLVLNYITGELYLEYAFEQQFIPRFKIDRINLLEMLNDWENMLLGP